MSKKYISTSTTGDFKVDKEQYYNKSGKLIQTMFNIRESNKKKSLTQETINEICNQYKSANKYFTVKAVTERDEVTTLKSKKGDFMDYDEDYFKMTAGESKRTFKQTFKSITIYVAEVGNRALNKKH
jgi:hypothetical protein